MDQFGPCRPLRPGRNIAQPAAITIERAVERPVKSIVFICQRKLRSDKAAIQRLRIQIGQIVAIAGMITAKAALEEIVVIGELEHCSDKPAIQRLRIQIGQIVAVAGMITAKAALEEIVVIGELEHCSDKAAVHACGSRSVR